ncbi:tetratricopeptide repeat protein [Shewanella sp.]|uniref:tetratricopeptide repeat protein n=1 Tax=Shewanella sp. TaxID=50422 RepID=UPI0040540C13
MSLINQVLQDLDKRQQAADKSKTMAMDEQSNASVISKGANAHHSPAHDFVRPQLQYQTQQKRVNTRSQTPLYLLMGTIAMTAVVAGVWLLSQAQNIMPQAEVDMAHELDVSPQVQPETEPQQAYALAAPTDKPLKQAVLTSALTDQVPENIEQIKSEATISEQVTPTVGQALASEPALALKQDNEQALPEKELIQEPLGVAKTVNLASETMAVPVNTKSPAGNMLVVEVVLTANQKANKLMLSAENAENSGRLAQAKADYLKVLALIPAQTTARKKLLSLYYAQGEQDKAMALVEQAISDSVEPWQWVLLKAKLQHSNGASAMALTTLATIPEQGVWAKDKWAAQGDIAQKLGQFSLSEQAYRALTLVEAHKGLWWMGLAYAQDSQQQYSLARQSYLAAYERAGLSSSARAFIENRLKELGESR